MLNKKQKVHSIQAQEAQEAQEAQKAQEAQEAQDAQDVVRKSGLQNYTVLQNLQKIGKEAARYVPLHPPASSLNGIGIRHTEQIDSTNHATVMASIRRLSVQSTLFDAQRTLLPAFTPDAPFPASEATPLWCNEETNTRIQKQTASNLTKLLLEPCDAKSNVQIAGVLMMDVLTESTGLLAEEYDKALFHIFS